jgi:hypothetical protein
MAKIGIVRGAQLQQLKRRDLESTGAHLIMKRGSGTTMRVRALAKSGSISDKTLAFKACWWAFSGSPRPAEQNRRQGDSRFLHSTPGFHHLLKRGAFWIF